MSFWPIFCLFVLWLNKGPHYGLFAVCRENSVSLCKLLWVTYFMINKQTMVQCFQELISVHSSITSVHFSVCWVHCGSAEMHVCSHRNASAITFCKTCLSICLFLWPDCPTVIPQKSHYSSLSSLLYCFQRWSKRQAKMGWTIMSSLVWCQPYGPPYTPDFYGNLSLSSFPLSLPVIFKCNTTPWNLNVITVFVQGQQPGVKAIIFPPALTTCVLFISLYWHYFLFSALPLSSHKSDLSCIICLGIFGGVCSVCSFEQLKDIAIGNYFGVWCSLSNNSPKVQ